ncbi:HAD family hydrolase [Alginatibacterium sediminis]|uniref:HAD family hydrolase n=1 Tax=Alginatibacterium sediminis TaxID=2164068 RepID=A0A420EDB3_9ALTE|nr:HAD hydrolase-like protein [Alginatibacterium sediminis]RKF18644.1 HAD family hydrolase [Alginatibacterium sediminis]
MERDLVTEKTYLFDWGDTLMRDFSDQAGKMCDWQKLEAMPNAQKALASLSQASQIYVATGAQQSTPKEIERAFERVGLAKYISGYYCPANLALQKGDAGFLPAILSKINQPAENCCMVGDNWERDIVPALEIGMQTIWYQSESPSLMHETVRCIKNLKDLIE